MRIVRGAGFADLFKPITEKFDQAKKFDDEP
jgi:hypothetical protein